MQRQKNYHTVMFTALVGIIINIKSILFIINKKAC